MGFAQSWAGLGTLWAEVLPGCGRDAGGEVAAQVPYRITVRAAPVGSEARPKPEQRFATARGYSRFWRWPERDAEGRYLTCFAREEVPHELSGSSGIASRGFRTAFRLSGFGGVSIVDAMPPGTAAGTFVLIGPEQVVDQSDKTGGGAEHRFEVAVISDASGFVSAKTVAGAVSEALVGLTLTTGRLVSIGFLRATARRLDGGVLRRIDMTFRARIEL